MYVPIIYKSLSRVYTRATTLINQRLAWPSAVKRTRLLARASHANAPAVYISNNNATMHATSGVITSFHIMLVDLAVVCSTSFVFGLSFRFIIIILITRRACATGDLTTAGRIQYVIYAQLSYRILL